MFGNDHEEISHLLGKDKPFYNSSADIARFQEWMSTKQVRGELMKRYTRSYLSKRRNPRHAEIKERKLTAGFLLKILNPHLSIAFKNSRRRAAR